MNNDISILAFNHFSQSTCTSPHYRLILGVKYNSDFSLKGWEHVLEEELILSLHRSVSQTLILLHTLQHEFGVSGTVQQEDWTHVIGYEPRTECVTEWMDTLLHTARRMILTIYKKTPLITIYSKTEKLFLKVHTSISYTALTI